MTNWTPINSLPVIPDSVAVIPDPVAVIPGLLVIVIPDIDPGSSAPRISWMPDQVRHDKLDPN